MKEIQKFRTGRGSSQILDLSQFCSQNKWTLPTSQKMEEDHRINHEHRLECQSEKSPADSRAANEQQSESVHISYFGWMAVNEISVTFTQRTQKMWLADYYSPVVKIASQPW